MEEAGASRPHGDLKPGLDRAGYSTSGTTALDCVEWVTLGWKVPAVCIRWRCSASKQHVQEATTPPHNVRAFVCAPDLQTYTYN